MYRKALSVVSIATAVVACVVGCGSSNNAPTAPGRVKVVNALPASTTQNVDIRIHGMLFATNIGFGAITPNSGGASEVPPGAQNVVVDVTGTSQQLAANTVNVDSSLDNLLLASGATAPKVSALGRVNLDGSSIPTSGQARVYFVNAIEGSTVTFSYTVTPDPNGENINSLPVLYPAMSNEQIVGVGTAQVSVTVGGATYSTSFTVEGKKVYLVVVAPPAQGAAGLSVLNFTLS